MVWRFPLKLTTQLATLHNIDTHKSHILHHAVRRRLPFLHDAARTKSVTRAVLNAPQRTPGMCSSTFPCYIAVIPRTNTPSHHLPHLPRTTTSIWRRLPKHALLLISAISLRPLIPVRSLLSRLPASSSSFLSTAVTCAAIVVMIV